MTVNNTQLMRLSRNKASVEAEFDFDTRLITVLSCSDSNLYQVGESFTWKDPSRMPWESLQIAGSALVDEGWQRFQVSPFPPLWEKIDERSASQNNEATK